MIISASRGTDIPKYYSDWFLNRIREGYVDVRNPIKHNQVSRYSLDPEIIDGIVFWTKDPSPLLDRLDSLSRYAYYFQFTLTAYRQDIECGLPDKQKLIEVFKQLSNKIGSDKVVWRFDPILINTSYTPDDIMRAFEYIASKLEGYTEKVIISFVDDYIRDRKAFILPLK